MNGNGNGNGNGYVNGLDRFFGNGVYRIIREFGFPIAVAVYLFFLLAEKDKQMANLAERMVQTSERGTAAVNELTTAVKDLRWELKGGR